MQTRACEGFNWFWKTQSFDIAQCAMHTILQLFRKKVWAMIDVIIFFHSSKTICSFGEYFPFFVSYPSRLIVSLQFHWWKCRRKNFFPQFLTCFQYFEFTFVYKPAVSTEYFWGVQAQYLFDGGWKLQTESICIDVCEFLSKHRRKQPNFFAESDRKKKLIWAEFHNGLWLLINLHHVIIIIMWDRLI